MNKVSKKTKNVVPQLSKNRKFTKKRAKKKSIGSCFVLMPFKEPFNTYYNTIIKPAVIAANLDPLRGDSLFRPSPIMGDVWAMIQSAKVLVAELTEKNANVFYELGLSHAIGKPVILLSETIDDVPFDLQPLRVILYNKNHPAWGNKLRSTLVASLNETLSDAVGAVPPMFRKAVKSQAPGESESTLRLAALERQVAALREKEFSLSGAVEVPRPLLSIEYMHHEMRKTKTMVDAMRLVQKWLSQGTPPDVIRIVLKNAMPKPRAYAILKQLGLRL